MKKIALIPVFNEAATLLDVLDTIRRQVDRLVVVDDGSRDGSYRLAQEWAGPDEGVTLLRLPENRGMSAALREGFLHLAGELAQGKLATGDVLFTLDADGQHESAQIPALEAHMRELRLDVALTRRDFSLYPAHKRLGNLLMTLWGSLWSGRRYRDVESGFRAMRVGVLPPLLRHYRGIRYSCAQEIAVLTTRLGFRVDDSFRSEIRHYRSQTGLQDVAINAAMSLCAFLHWAFRRQAR